ncbi:unnamed protein product [Cyclocybe aegerita]|uniref:Uncharacterized protein n=1 Tax=Cyclocybe aegerita TaxID=1973307 RepID=A0A8S0X9E4_CYCAE|nr:unnamed protein product [Cyclocybe aegerita]
MPNRMPSLTELHFDAHIFTPALFYLDHSEKREFASHTVLPDLERLAFERATPAPYTTGDVILNLVQAGWTKLAPRNRKRGRVEISFQPAIVPESSCVSLQDLERIKADQVVNHISARGILDYELHLRFPPVGEI